MNNVLKIILMLMTFLFMTSTVTAFSFQVLSTNPAPIQAGEYADVTIRIDTFAGGESSELDNIKIYPKETDYIKPVPGQDVLINSLNTGQSLTRTFRIFFSESIPTGEIPLTLVYENNGQKLEQSDSIYVSGALRSPELYIGEIRSVPDKLLQDTKGNTLNLVLQNLGQKEAELLTVELISDSEIVTESFSYSLTESLASIKPGEQQTISFTFDIEETDVLTIPSTLNLRYRTLNDFDNTYSTLEEEIDFDIRLTDSPRFEIVNMEKLNEFQAGTSGNRLKITIENVGEREGKSVRLRLYPDPSAPFDFERTSIFVTSNIKPQETVSFILPFDILDEALVQSYFINADFESLVGENRYVQSERIEIENQMEASRGTQIYLFSLIFLSLAIAFIIGFFYNRKKKNKK